MGSGKLNLRQVDAEKWSQFEEIRGKMPDLVAAMAKDIQDRDLVRVFIAERKNERFDSGNTTNLYREVDIPELMQKVQLLKSEGWVENVTSELNRRVPRFEMTKDLVEMLSLAAWR